MDTTPMTREKALSLRRGDRIYVQMSGRRQRRLAVVTNLPRSITTDAAGRYIQYAVVPFAYVRHISQGGAERGSETLSRQDHVAVVPSSDHLWADE